MGPIGNDRVFSISVESLVWIARDVLGHVERRRFRSLLRGGNVMRALILSLLLTVLVVSVAGAATRHVPSEYPTIQAALNASVAGDIVFVAAGTYHENLTMKDGVTLTSESGPGTTVIHGDGTNSVISCAGLSSATNIVGFTIQSGAHGVVISGGGPRIAGNIIRDNGPTADGAGIYCENCTALIEENTFQNNSSTGWGGGGVLVIGTSNVTIRKNIFRNNSAVYGGGGVGMSGATATASVSENLFWQNTARYGGGIGSGNGARITIESNTFYANEALYGASINLGPASATVRKNIIAGSMGAGLRCDGPSVVSGCNDYWGNQSDCEGCTFNPESDMTVDPLFCDAAHGDFHLEEGSPCDDHPACGRIGAYGLGCPAVPTPHHPVILSISPPAARIGHQVAVVFALVDGAGQKVWDRGVSASVGSVFGLGTFGTVSDLPDTTYQVEYTAGLSVGTDSVYVHDPECTGDQRVWASIDITGADHPEIVSVSKSNLGLGEASQVVFRILDGAGSKMLDVGVQATLSSLSGLGTFGPITPLPDTTYTAMYVAGFVAGEDSICVYDAECGGNNYAWAVVDIIPAPDILSVEDVPNDQGGRVSIGWRRSSIDAHPDTFVTHYSIWRSVTSASETESADLAVVTAADVGPDFQGPGHRLAVLGFAMYLWEWIANVPAHHFEGYSYTAPTLQDSTSLSPAQHYFLVSAHTDRQLVFRDSEPDSGYSVDNLAPDPPAGVRGQYTPGEGILLAWAPNDEADLSHYAVYRGADPDFVPGPESFLGATADTSFVDRSSGGFVSYFYKLSALDIHENESRWSVLRVEAPTAAYSPELAAAMTEQGICLSWKARPGASGYHVYQREEGQDVYSRLTEAAISPGSAAYSYELSSYPNVTTYFMLAVLLDGETEMRYGPVVVYPLSTQILSCSPNPFTNGTRVRYTSAADGRGTLRVFDSSGRLVRLLQEGVLVRGAHSLTWNGRTGDGEEVCAGVYFVQLEVGGIVDTRKIVLIRR